MVTRTRPPTAGQVLYGFLYPDTKTDWAYLSRPEKQAFERAAADFARHLQPPAGLHLSQPMLEAA